MMRKYQVRFWRAVGEATPSLTLLFSIAGLKEQVEQSEQVVKQSFASVMESPEATTKKLLNKIRQRRNQ